MTGEALLKNMTGIIETKIFMLDILIKLARKQKGIIYLEDLESIRKGLIQGSKEAELDDIFTMMENKENGKIKNL